MTSTTKITATYQQIPFAEAYISSLNPRSVINEASIAALAENIRQLGLINPLSGLTDEAGRIGIVAGGRRYRALALLQDDPRFQTVTVHIAPDEATAAIWASSENHQREQPHPVDEIREYGRMEARGIVPAAIAMAFGVTEKHVYRRLALAKLPGPVLDALRANEISLSNAAAFTIGDDEARMLEVLEQVRREGISDHSIKRMLKPDAVRQTDRRAIWVGEEAYREAGGRIGGDLFAEETLFDDPGLLEQLFRDKLDAATVVRMDELGWKWCEFVTESYLGWHHIEQGKYARLYPVAGDLTEAEAVRYDELADLANGDALDEAGEAELADLQARQDGAYSVEQKTHAGAILYIDREGGLLAEEGLVRAADRKAAEEAGLLPPSQHEAASDSTALKSPISQKLADDLARVATGARQHAALRDPEMILALLAFQLTGKAGHRRPFGLREDKVANLPTTERAGYALDERLTTPAGTPADPWGSDLARGFRSFKGMGPEHVMAELVRHLAALLDVKDAKLAGVIDKAVRTDIREVWTPTAENFFVRVGGPYLDGLWRDLLDLAADHPTVTTFQKLKKAEKAERLESLFGDEARQDALRLTADQKARIAAWLPEGMA